MNLGTLQARAGKGSSRVPHGYGLLRNQPWCCRWLEYLSRASVQIIVVFSRLLINYCLIEEIAESVC